MKTPQRFSRLLALRKTAGLLAYSPTIRAFACLHFAALESSERILLSGEREVWVGFGEIRELPALWDLGREIAEPLKRKLQQWNVKSSEQKEHWLHAIGEEVSASKSISTSAEALSLKDTLLSFLDEIGSREDLRMICRALEAFLRLSCGHSRYVEALLGSATSFLLVVGS